MATPLFTPSSIAHFKRKAKEIQRARKLRSPSDLNDSDLKLSSALDEVARLHGFENWSLLMKNGTRSNPLPIVELTCIPYPDGVRGVFLLSMDILDQALKQRIESENVPFELPTAKDWMFRKATEGSGHIPYLDGRVRLWQGIFHQGRWAAILSRNGVQDAEYPLHLETLDWVLQAVRIHAEAALKVHGGDAMSHSPFAFRLFTQRGNRAQAELKEIGFDTLEEAKQHKLPEGDQPVSISTADGWYTYQVPFGWEGPFPSMRRPRVA